MLSIIIINKWGFFGGSSTSHALCLKRKRTETKNENVFSVNETASYELPCGSVHIDLATKFDRPFIRIMCRASIVLRCTIFFMF